MLYSIKFYCIHDNIQCTVSGRVSTFEKGTRINENIFVYSFTRKLRENDTMLKWNEVEQSG